MDHIELIGYQLGKLIPVREVFMDEEEWTFDHLSSFLLLLYIYFQAYML